MRRRHLTLLLLRHLTHWLKAKSVLYHGHE
jgi:hypothetical protein